MRESHGVGSQPTVPSPTQVPNTHNTENQKKPAGNDSSNGITMGALQMASPSAGNSQEDSHCQTGKTISHVPSATRPWVVNEALSRLHFLVPML